MLNVLLGLEAPPKVIGSRRVTIEKRTDKADVINIAPIIKKPAKTKIVKPTIVRQCVANKNARADKIVEFIAQYGPKTFFELRIEFKIGTALMYRTLKELTDNGRLLTSGTQTRLWGVKGQQLPERCRKQRSKKLHQILYDVLTCDWMTTGEIASKLETSNRTSISRALKVLCSRGQIHRSTVVLGRTGFGWKRI